MVVNIILFQRILDMLESGDGGNYLVGGDKGLYSSELFYVGTDIIDHPTPENHPFRVYANGRGRLHPSRFRETVF